VFSKDSFFIVLSFSSTVPCELKLVSVSFIDILQPVLPSLSIVRTAHSDTLPMREIEELGQFIVILNAKKGCCKTSWIESCAYMVMKAKVIRQTEE
jgi:hypothetical protein